MLQPTARSRVVLITGASSGIGQATARRMARAGATLFLVGRDQARLERVAHETHATPIRADVTQPDDVTRIADTVGAAAGQLDVLINSAGQFEVGPALPGGVELMERLMRVNVSGSIHMIEACLPLLQADQHASIVNVASLAGRIAPPYMAAYAASKFALVGYTRSLRQELRPTGIHVGLVLPAPVATPMVHGKLDGRYYPRPPGVPVLTADQVARGIVQVIERRMDELILPRHLALPIALGSAFPHLVDWVYKVMLVVRRRRQSEE